MKICPICRQAYHDTQNFCLQDGAVLYDPEATLIMPGLASDSGNEVLPYGEHSDQPLRPITSIFTPTIQDILNQKPVFEKRRRNKPSAEQVDFKLLKHWETFSSHYEHEVLAYLYTHRSQFGIEQLFHLKNQCMNGEAILQNGSNVLLLCARTIGWAEACQAKWQFSEFINITGRTDCKMAIVFFEKFGGRDWNKRKSVSCSMPKGWFYWYESYHRWEGWECHLVRLQDEQIETYADAEAK